MGRLGGWIRGESSERALVGGRGEEGLGRSRGEEKQGWRGSRGEDEAGGRAKRGEGDHLR